MTMRIALSMIMKNEEKVLPRLLNSVYPLIDYYCILDTGSTDNSISLVKDFFDSKGISGEILVNTDCVEVIDGETCFIYDKARNEAIKMLKGKADYGFFIDCDEELVLSDSFNKEEFKGELYKYDLGSVLALSEVNYSRRCFFNVSKPFRWAGKIHEVLVCDEDITETFLKNISVIIHKDETDSNPEKYRKHALVLKKEVEEKNGARDLFYLANSYKDSGDLYNAIDCYKKRADRVDGFYEERYYSQFMIGNLLWRLEKPYSEVLVEFLKCNELDSVRGEHLINSIIILQNNNLWHNAYILSKYALEKIHRKNPYPNRLLFLHASVYTDMILDAHIRNCNSLKKVDNICDISDSVTFDDVLKSIPSGWKDNRVICNWIVNKINPKLTVELGVDYGYSTLCLSEYNKGLILAYDHFKGDEFTGYRDTEYFAKKIIKDCAKLFNVGNNVKIEKLTSDEAFKKINKRKIDLLHIDSLATYESVSKDFNNWSKCLSENGVILIQNTKVHSGVKKFFSEISIPKFELDSYSGFGIVSKNAELIKEITSIFGKVQEKNITDISEKRERITIGFINHNEEVYNKLLKPSIDNLKGDFDIIFTDDKEKPSVNYNKIIDESKNRYILLVHQDVTFGDNLIDNIFESIDNIKRFKEFSDFGALGIVGIKENGSYSWSEKGGVKEVEKLDCCCILINKEHGLRFDEKTFDDFHLYVEDYCLQAKYKLNLKSWVISINASEAGKDDVYENKKDYFKHHSATVNKLGYAWGRYWEYDEKLKNKWNNFKNEVDVCIISYAKNDDLYKVTTNGIETLLKSEENIKFNVFVVESNKEVNYDHLENTKTIYPDIPFNYNAYLNLAVRQGKSKYVMLCNNDLTYEKGFATEIIKQMNKDPYLLSASPFCPQVHKSELKDFEVLYGYMNRMQLCGWAIFQDRKIYDYIKELNEDVYFWFSDNIYGDQLISKSIKHGLVTKSVVNHHEDELGLTGNSILSNEEREKLMMGQMENYLKAKKKVYNL